MKLDDFYTVMLRLLLVFIPLYLVYWYIARIMGPIDMAMGHLATNIEYPNIILRYWNNFTTILVSNILSLAGVSNHYQRSFITIKTDTAPIVLFIGWQCNFLLPFISYTAMVMAITKIKPKDRLLGISGGLFLIYLGNLIRIAALGMIGSWYGEGSMQKYHALFFNKGLAVWTMLVFLAWIAMIGGAGVLERSFGIE